MRSTCIAATATILVTVAGIWRERTARLLAGVPADLAWRFERGRRVRRKGVLG